MINLHEMASDLRVASNQMAHATDKTKRHALEAISNGLSSYKTDVLDANHQDVQDGRKAGISEALLDRMTLTTSRLDSMASDVRSISKLPDPVGQTFDERRLPNGLLVCRKRVPIGALGVIYESRPNVTIEVAALAIKTGNVAMLRGGSETLRSNRALVSIVRNALLKSGLPQDSVQFVDDRDRKYVRQLLRMHEYLDLIIPRGGLKLHEFCRENSTIPVITGGIGICHLFVDDSANLSAAMSVIHNAKVQRPSVCNALDTLLVHQSIASRFVPQVAAKLAKDGVTFRAEPRAYLVLEQENLPIQTAGPQDFDTEWLSLIMGLKIVDGLDEAIDHIKEHSTAHSDGILTQTLAHEERFLDEIDSAAVYVNASTRFTDGAQLGLGAEVAVSTQRLHARGPMGLPELTTYKWIVRGDYTIRE